MLTYTICFIKQGTKFLMLNREFPSWMGVWNGVGGKIEKDESPIESIIREVYEETGLSIHNPQFRGIATWVVDGVFVDGMYIYIAELPSDEVLQTPVKTIEGILDWKEYDWLMHPKNVGITSDMSKYLKYIVLDENLYEHRCFYQDGKLVEHSLIKIDKNYDLLENKKQIEKGL